MSLVLLPCEIFHREFDAKLILAARLAAEKKMTVMIGYDKFFNNLIPLLPRAILLDKSCSSIVYNGRIRSVKKKNGTVLINDEEGFNDLTSNYKYSWLNRVDRQAATSIDNYLAWGGYDKKFFSQVDELNGKIEIAGNCRSDLLNDIGKQYFRDCISSYSNLFNDFVLISDNFCVERWKENYILPTFNVDSEKASAAQLEFEESQRVSKDKREFMSRLLEPVIMQRQDINFVIRPHPVANPLWWQNRFNKHRNVFVIYQNSIDPWIHSCRMLISMGCTTAIQALIAKKNVIELKMPNDPFETTSPSFASRLVPNTASSSEELSFLLSKPPAVNGFPSLLTEAWSTLSNSSTSTFADIISRYYYQMHSSDINKLNSILNQVNLYNMPPLDKEKWPYPSYQKIKNRLKNLCSSIQFPNSLTMKQIIPGLYLLTSPSGP